ncbi:MAG: response regulator, partial [Chloroflexota bacterium]|nr:response regulator [Chloroflexota bacterium]
PAMSTIIVVDDDKVFRELLATVLELEGHRAIGVTDPTGVTDTVRREEPALVLMDIHIGNQDTLGVLRELKSDEALRGVPVIMTSGMDQRHECLQAGADAFVLKPFRPSEMLTIIKELTEPAD